MMTTQSAIKFPGASRVHIGLAVSDLARSRAFYKTLLGIYPTKERPGYIKFESEDPSVNLTLHEVQDAERVDNSTRHYGIQVKSPQAVQEAITRFSQAGLTTEVEEQTACCYAVQDKVWVADPEGNRWEVFVVLQADAEARTALGSQCCAPTVAQSPSSACCDNDRAKA